MRHRRCVCYFVRKVSCVQRVEIDARAAAARTRVSIQLVKSTVHVERVHTAGIPVYVTIVATWCWQPHREATVMAPDAVAHPIHQHRHQLVITVITMSTGGAAVDVAVTPAVVKEDTAPEPTLCPPKRL